MKVCRHSPALTLRRIVLFGAIVLAALAISFAADAKPLSTSPALNRIVPGAALSERFLSRRADGAVLVDLLIQGEVPPGLLRARGIEVNTVAGGWLTARCPLGLLNALYDIPGIERVEISQRCQPLLDVSVADAGVSSVRTVGPTDITGETGQGVVVGIVDTGVDLHHRDLQNANGSTRVVSLWDQTATSGTPPAGFTYGAEYDSAAINRGLSPETDTDGHGTHVVTTAAGNGRATGNGQPANVYVGVAPKADVIAVKTTYATTSIIDGVSYVFLQAAALGKKAVVNLSLGTQDGPHDGTYGFDTMISALTGPGKIVCASAGNKQLDDSHAQIDLNGTTPAVMTLNVPSYTKSPQTQNDFLIFSGWYPGDDQISVTITSPGGDVVGPVTPSTSANLNSSDGYINVFNATTFPSNGDNEIYIEIYDEFASKAPQPGTWTFTFTPISLPSTGIVDMYLYGNQLGNGANIARWVTGLVPFGVIGSPGSADSVITVAAHTTKACWTSVNGNSYCWNPLPALDDIAPFSSHGPLRNGKLKPDLSAPGNGVAAGLSAAASLQTELVVPDGVHVMLAGTSMSTPHVVGAVALLLAQPAWSGATPSAIRQRLQSTARSDAFTGTLPNATWGYGKLNAAAALAPLTTLLVTHPPKGFFMPPGKPDSVTVVLGGMTADSVTIDLSLNGGASYSVPLGTLHAVAPGAPRSLSFFVDPAWSTLQAKVRCTARNATTTQTGTSDSLFAIQAPVGVEELGVDALPRLALDPSRPNPFNPTTTIGFEIAKPGRATLRIFSAQGALIRTLVDEPLRAGRYRTVWDGRDGRGRPASSGVYFSELQADGTRLVRKMSLLK
ncbi:MAG TPA: S8 family serine peptidase [Candidatus Eisenbacteria bacterium]|nr:S8 family serine peptidase [Candidatus Eisenbacteria bacterium]